MAEDKVVGQILAKLDTKKPQIKQNAKVVEDVIKALNKQFEESNVLTRAHFMHGGSAFESLSINDDTDFDIIMVLPIPYVAEKFEVVPDANNYFSLKWKIAEKMPRDSQGYLDAATLQLQVFQELKTCMCKVHVDGVNRIEYKPQLAAFTLTITTTTGPTISVDLVPQIAVKSWGPYLVPLHQLPRQLQDYVTTLENNGTPIYFFSPAAPGNFQNKHRLCNIAFSMLEKDFLKKNIDIRDMVRLVKLVGVVLEWPQKYGLKAFHIKRLALKFSDQLKQKSKWDGYRFLLESLRSELQHNKVLYGFFIRNQVIYNKKPDIIEKLCKDISEVYFWSPSMVKERVEEYIGC